MSLHGLSLCDLVSLVAVSDHGRCGLTADACHVSLPSRSAGMGKIEEALDDRVFGRPSRNVLIARKGAIAIQGVTGRQRHGGGFDKARSGGDNRTVQSGSVP